MPKVAELDGKAGQQRPRYMVLECAQSLLLCQIVEKRKERKVLFKNFLVSIIFFQYNIVLDLLLEHKKFFNVN